MQHVFCSLPIFIICIRTIASSCHTELFMKNLFRKAESSNNILNSNAVKVFRRYIHDNIDGDVEQGFYVLIEIWAMPWCSCTALVIFAYFKLQSAQTYKFRLLPVPSRNSVSCTLHDRTARIKRDIF